MTADLNADLVEILRAAWPDAVSGWCEECLEVGGVTLDSGDFARILAWANARRDAAVAKWRALLPECDCHLGRSCDWPRCQQIKVNGAPTLPTDTRDAEIARLRSALEAIDALPTMEINPSNYGYDDVCELNANAVEAVSIARAALEPQPPEPSR